MKRNFAALATWVAAAVALGAIVAWPAYVQRASDAAHASALPPPAPVTPDYLERDKLIRFWEGAVNEHHHGDMLSPRMLSAQYLQRFREQGDTGDVLRAVNTAQLSLRAQPYGNEAADVALASAYLTLHRFKDALAVTKRIESYDPGVPDMLIREASLDLELGRYDQAQRLIDAPANTDSGGLHPVADIAGDTLRARWLELSGHLPEARRIFERTTAYENAQFGEGAEQRAWFYMRAGELAFEAGDNDAAIDDETRSLAVFPNFADASRFRARFECALHRWQACDDDAERSAEIVPYPETLGYEVDALRALGDTRGATATDDLIHTVERLGNAQRVSDRLLAIYYSEHGERLDAAYRIARRELAVRDDIFTEDTLAWAAAMDGRWNEARVASVKALRFDTENALLQYHAGAIALHFGERVEAKRRLMRALALNPSFHPFYADDARRMLAAL
ncbi:MAG: tetratricopeptide repeat protein [Vulcanimicrobiaceae bacterium]